MFTWDCKYIVYDDGMLDVAILFPNHMDHSRMSMALACSPVSAGFVRIEQDPFSVVCHGDSHTLGNLSSRPEEDAEIITRMLRISGQRS